MRSSLSDMREGIWEGRKKVVSMKQKREEEEEDE